MSARHCVSRPFVYLGVLALPLTVRYCNRDLWRISKNKRLFFEANEHNFLLLERFQCTLHDVNRYFHPQIC